MKAQQQEAAVRRMLERTPPPVPQDLHAEAVRRGVRMLRRRAVARRLMWLALFAAALAFMVWAWTARPWVESPSTTTPPVSRW